VTQGIFQDISRNELVIRIQPSEAIYLKLNNKTPGLHSSALPAELDLTYKRRFSDVKIPEAYEALILDAINGDHSNFVRDDELDVAWKVRASMRARLLSSLCPLLPLFIIRCRAHLRDAARAPRACARTMRPAARCRARAMLRCGRSMPPPIAPHILALSVSSTFHFRGSRLTDVVPSPCRSSRRSCTGSRAGAVSVRSRSSTRTARADRRSWTHLRRSTASSGRGRTSA
jgi:hypothetical protein